MVTFNRRLFHSLFKAVGIAFKLNSKQEASWNIMQTFFWRLNLSKYSKSSFSPNLQTELVQLSKDLLWLLLSFIIFHPLTSYFFSIN